MNFPAQQYREGLKNGNHSWYKHVNLNIVYSFTLSVKKFGQHVKHLLDGEYDEGDHHQLQVLLHRRQLQLPGLCYLHLGLSSKGFLF